MNRTTMTQQIDMHKLRIGDEEAIWTFGSDAQALLGLASRTISSAMSSAAEDGSISLISQTAAALNAITEQKKRRFFGLFPGRRSASEAPEALQKQIRELAVILQLRSARLAKETALLRQAEKDLTDCCEQLDACIQSGHAFLSKSTRSYGPDEHNWLQRFERRLEELQLTKTVALQSEAQAQLLRSAKEDLMQKLQSIVTVVIPLWRTHASVLWGMQSMQSESLERQKLEKTVKEELLRNQEKAAAAAEALCISGDRHTDNLEALLKSSRELCESLKAIADEERKCSLLETGTILDVSGKE